MFISWVLAQRQILNSPSLSLCSVLLSFCWLYCDSVWLPGGCFRFHIHVSTAPTMFLSSTGVVFLGLPVGRLLFSAPGVSCAHLPHCSPSCNLFCCLGFTFTEYAVSKTHMWPWAWTFTNNRCVITDTRTTTKTNQTHVPVFYWKVGWSLNKSWQQHLCLVLKTEERGWSLVLLKLSIHFGHSQLFPTVWRRCSVSIKHNADFPSCVPQDMCPVLEFVAASCAEQAWREQKIWL